MPEVSVIIPAWNAAGFIGAALACALGQQDVDLEVVVADDASPDDTGVVVQAVGDSRVRYLRLPRNRGPAAARNAAFAAAAGEWLLILDADDAMDPGRARRLIDVGRQAGADIVADNFWLVDPTAPAQRRLHIAEALDGGVESLSLAGYMRANRLFQREPGLGYLKPLFRAAFLREHALAYDETLRIGEDYALVVEAMVRGARYARLREAGYDYSARAGSISHRLSPENLAAMIDFDHGLLERHRGALSADERAAGEAHLASLEEAAAFFAMVGDLKARRLGAFAGRAVARPAALRHFAIPLRDRLRRRGR